jgi:hypothetical protein
MDFKRGSYEKLDRLPYGITFWFLQQPIQYDYHKSPPFDIIPSQLGPNNAFTINFREYHINIILA